MTRKQPFEDMVIAPASAEEIAKVALRRASSLSIKLGKKPRLEKVKKLESARIRTISRYTVKRLRDICFSVPRISELHPFYQEWVKVLIDVDKFRKNLAHIHAASKVIEKIEASVIWKLRGATTFSEVRKAKKEFLGRYFSVLEDIDETLREIREAQLKLVKLQAIDPQLPTVVVAGPPNVGKSSLVRAISTAEPEVREYPFTTKELTIGHIVLSEEEKIQVVDTPGLLDRPLSERNEIELRAILAIKYLAKIVLFLIDPSETCGFLLDYQLGVLKDVYNAFSELPFVLVINKIDITPPAKLASAERMLAESIKEDVKIFKISALTGEGVEELKNYILKSIGRTQMASTSSLSQEEP